MKTSCHDQPTPYLNRRDQYRMLAMVGLLSLVMIAIKFAAQPSSWYWLLPPSGGDGSATNIDDDGVPLKELDFRVKDDRSVPLPPGVFRAVAAVDDLPISDEDASSDDDAAPSEAVDVAISADVLEPIEDNTIGVRGAEAEAYLLMLDRIRQLPRDAVDAHAKDDVAFTVIMLQSADYRGELIQITGQLHRLTEYPVLKNDLGIDQLYEGWLFTNDSENHPWRFVCTQLPVGVTPGETIEPVKIQLTGYFFKRMGYASRGGQHVAPTLLARTFRVLPIPLSNAPQMQAEMRNWMLGVVGLVIVTMALLVWRFVVDDRRFKRSRLSHLAASRLDADPADLAALKDVSTIDPTTMFAQGVDSTDGADESA